MISVEQLTKYFGRVRALSDVSFKVEPGEVVGVLGPNGAGKTTLMRVLTGYFPPTSGRVEINGLNMENHRSEIQRNIGYLPESAPLYSEMTPEEMLGFVAGMKKVSRSLIKKSIERSLDSCGISRVRRRLIGTLSKGYRQRVALAAALIGSPKILILDEPTSSLDPEQIVQIRELIRNLRGEHTIILSTHILHEVSLLTERVLILHEGRLVASDRLEQLHGQLKSDQEMLARIRGSAPRLLELLADIPGVKQVRCLDVPIRSDIPLRYAIVAKESEDVSSELTRRVIEGGFELLELTQLQSSLEDVYLSFVKQKAYGKIEEKAD